MLGLACGFTITLTSGAVARERSPACPLAEIPATPPSPEPVEPDDVDPSPALIGSSVGGGSCGGGGSGGGGSGGGLSGGGLSGGGGVGWRPCALLSRPPLPPPGWTPSPCGGFGGFAWTRSPPKTVRERRTAAVQAANSSATCASA